jgi:hypothetical protein
MRVVAILFFVLGLAVASAHGQSSDTSALINQALDKNVSLNEDSVLPVVLKHIEDKTGVRITPSDDLYDLLPWGEQTNLRISFEQKTLRVALTAIARKLGLVWELGKFDISLKPMPALSRLGRRATIAELSGLELLRSTNLAGWKESMTTRELLMQIDRQLAHIKDPALALDIRTGDAADPQAGLINMDKPVAVPRDTPLAIVLEDLTRQSDATWYPWGVRIVVVPKEQHVRMLLDKSVTAHFNGVDIGKIFEELATASGTDFKIEPGAFQRVPPEYRNIKLDLDNATVRQALENIRGVTGLDYIVNSDGVYVWNQNAARPPSIPIAAQPLDPVIAMIQMDGGFQMLLRESDFTPDMLAYLLQKKKSEIAKIRKEMVQKGFVAPTTQPATMPAGQ